MTYQEYLNSGFQRALREFKAQNQDEEEVIKEVSSHEYTTNSVGWKICVSCGLHIKRSSTFVINDYGHRVFFRETGSNKGVVIMETLIER